MGRMHRIKSLRLNEKVARHPPEKGSLPVTDRSLPMEVALVKMNTGAVRLEGSVSPDEDSAVHDAAGVVRAESARHHDEDRSLPMKDGLLPTKDRFGPMMDRIRFPGCSVCQTPKSQLHPIPAVRRRTWTVCRPTGSDRGTPWTDSHWSEPRRRPRPLPARTGPGCACPGEDFAPHCSTWARSGDSMRRGCCSGWRRSARCRAGDLLGVPGDPAARPRARAVGRVPRLAGAGGRPVPEVLRSGFPDLAMVRNILWNFVRPGPLLRQLEGRYRRRLTGLTLGELPERPVFTFCATDLTFGANWEFTRDRGGELSGGVSGRGGGVAAGAGGDGVGELPAGAGSDGDPGSAGGLPAGQVSRGGWRPAPAGGRAERWRGVRQHGAGAGVEGVEPGADLRLRGAVRVRGGEDLPAAADAVHLGGDGADPGAPAPGVLRRHRCREVRGAYWSLGRGVRLRKEGEPAEGYAGYSEGLAEEVLGKVRTDLDRFTAAEMSVLENHGYWSAERAVRRYAPRLVGAGGVRRR